MIPRRRPEIDQAWQDYQDACEKLTEMRLEATATQMDCQLQLQECEKLLQEWIELTQHFTTSLN